MAIIKSYDPQRWLFKTRYMSDWLYDETLPADLAGLAGATVSLEQIFENQEPLAHNHWLGIVRIAQAGGAYRQYLVSTAANSPERALAALRHEAVRRLLAAGFDPQANRLRLGDETACQTKYRHAA